jgi:antirestriction protein ArdC
MASTATTADSASITTKSQRRPQPSTSDTTRLRADERLCQQLIALMHQGVNPWRKPWDQTRCGPHRNLLTNRPYQGGNPALLELHLTLRGSDLPLWIGFQQAAAQGWHPRKGSHGCLIYSPLLVPRSSPTNEPVADQRARPEPNTSAITKEPLDCECPSEQANTSSTAVLRFRSALVFHAADLQDASPSRRPRHHRPIAAAIDNVLSAMAPPPLDQRLAAAEQHLAAWPVPLLTAASHAFYLPSHDRIHLPPRAAFHSPEAFLATWAHEQIHSTGHSSRLNRPGITGHHPSGSDAYAREELIAELGAFLLTQRLAIASDAANHAAYLHHWAALLGQGPQQLTSVLAEASRAANLLCPETAAQS